jgi:hypothetical protein
LSYLEELSGISPTISAALASSINNRRKFSAYEFSYLRKNQYVKAEMVCKRLRHTQSEDLAMKSKMARVETLAISMFF